MTLPSRVRETLDVPARAAPEVDLPQRAEAAELAFAEEVVRPAAAGNPSALRALVSEHLDFVWRALRRFGVPPADVDDAAQQVFLIVNQKAALIQAGSERSFLVGVALRVASHARRACERRLAMEQRFSSHPPPLNPDPEELAQRLEAREALDRVLDAMPTELRAVFTLFELEELSIEQIAAALCIPRGTVASRLRRAREVFHTHARLLEAAAHRAEVGSE